jgi:putative FmdB family regulatory protein
MPIYEFICGECSHAFEKRVPSSRSRVACPRCRGTKVAKQFSTFAFKGEFKFVGSRGGCGRCSSTG